MIQDKSAQFAHFPEYVRERLELFKNTVVNRRELECIFCIHNLECNFILLQNVIKWPRIMLFSSRVNKQPIKLNKEMFMLEFIHIVLAFVALVTGIIVLYSKKGTKRHKAIGKVYFFSMIGLNVTALGIFNLYGKWGQFHWFALASLVTVIAAYISIRYKKGVAHYYFSTWSYVGLLGGAISELFARFPPAENLLGVLPHLDSYLIVLLISLPFYLLPKYQRKVVSNA